MHYEELHLFSVTKEDNHIHSRSVNLKGHILKHALDMGVHHVGLADVHAVIRPRGFDQLVSFCNGVRFMKAVKIVCSTRATFATCSPTKRRHQTHSQTTDELIVRYCIFGEKEEELRRTSFQFGR